MESISNIYESAKKYSGFNSFKNYCAHYVNLQLLLLSINKSYIGGNGNDEYDNYKDMNYTAGGRKVHAYPATNASLKETLYSLSALGDVVTDVLVGFQWTNTTAGKKYGHTLLIRGIIGEYVYFSDSFGFVLNDGTRYEEGQPIKWTIDKFVAFYGGSAYTVEGLIWFEDEELTEALVAAGRWYGEGGGSQPETPPEIDPDPATETGKYRITYENGMRLRSGPGQSYGTVDLMPVGTELYVVEVKNGWGYTYYNGKLGWCCLTGYTERIGDLPPFMVDKYEGDTFISRVNRTTLSAALSEAVNTDVYNYTVSAYSDVSLTSNVTLGSGVTLYLGNYELDCGNYSFTLDGGVVRATKSVPALKANGFITETVSDGTYIYTMYTAQMEFTAVSLILNDNVSLRFTARVSGISSMKNASVVMITTDEEGIVTEYAPDSSNGDIYVFTTDGIPSKELADRLTVVLCVRSESLGDIGEIRGGQISYSPADYVQASYGSGALFDNLLAAMLNYGTQAQKYFNYNSSLPANSVLPEDMRNIKGDSSVLIRANPAPIVNGTSTVHVTRAQLALLDNVALRLYTDGDAGDSDLTLLIWSEADYLALKARAEAEGREVSYYLVKGNETKSLADEEGAFILEDIKAKEFADTYYFRLCQTEGGATEYDYVFSYSVTTYCAEMVGDNVENDIDPLCMAIAQYCAAAREYFGYEINGGK
ncbi:MAG: SH3 domain-containing protein [Eubacteriales bacterium]